MRQEVQAGFYGKLPSHGDFLRRRASDAFVGAWDRWLQGGIAASRSLLGERWLDVYLTSPAWRFACAPGACGPAAVAGVMAPSVDRVGRYFPLTVVAELPSSTTVATTMQATAFFDAAEQLIIETLEAEDIDFDRFDESVTSLTGHLEAVLGTARLVLDPAAASMLGDDPPDAFHIPLDSPARPGSSLAELALERLAAVYHPLALWWTEGSSIVGSSCLVSKGLPRPERFAAFLDGLWIERDWPSLPVHLEMGSRRVHASESAEPQPCRFRSAAASDTGRLRAKNQDAFLERPEVGVWAVADGLGGHSEGELASRMVCDALADWIPDSSFERTIEQASRRIDEVNDHLVHLAARSLHAERIATTVVALLTRGAECAVIWAGDSRAYRWRDGELERLTRDHSLAEAEDAGRRAPSNVITRALGAEPDLALDVSRYNVRPGDRFLLCSDGLTHTVPDARIQASLGGPDIQKTVRHLIQAALDAGGPDNVTVLVVEAC